MVKLTNRLQSVADAVPKCGTATDVGTDHAYIPIYLVQNGIAQRAIATDIAKGPAEIAGENIKSHGLSDKITVQIADGLNDIRTVNVPCCSGLPDVVIIAGMGGKLISDILYKAADCHRTDTEVFVLQPMTAIYELRRFLYENNYEIVAEDLAKEDDKIYNILTVKPLSTVNCQPPTDIELHIGKNHKHPGMLKEYIEKKVQSLSTAIENMGNSDGAAVVEKRKELAELRNLLCSWQPKELH